MSLPAVNCVWCGKGQPANANAYLEGIAVQDADGAWIIRSFNDRGITTREWVSDSVEYLAGDCELIDDENGALLIVSPESDWQMVAHEAGVAILEARRSLDTAMRAGEIAARMAVDDGLSEVKAADALNVDRMTVRKWLGK